MKRSFSESCLINRSKKDTTENAINAKNTKDTLNDNLNYQCSICKDVLLFPCTLGCGHSFCYRCLKDLHNHIHGVRIIGEPSDESYPDSDSEVDEEPAPRQLRCQSTASSYRDAFFNNQCFKSVVGKGTFNHFSSNLLMDKDKLLSHILNDSVFCDNCPKLQCPTCRLAVKVLPKPNILLHELLKNTLGELYEIRTYEYLTLYCEDVILEKYEQSERFKTIKMLVSESIRGIEQAVTFGNLMASFSAYGPEEIVWCLYKLSKGNTFVIVKDIIISHEYYSSDFEILLRDQKVTSDDINYLIVSHPSFSLAGRSPSLVSALKKRFKGVRTGILSLMDDEIALNEAMRKCIIANNLLEW